MAKTLSKSIDWNQRAKEYGFQNMQDVRNFQRANGLQIDGKVGNKTISQIQNLPKVSRWYGKVKVPKKTQTNSPFGGNINSNYQFGVNQSNQKTSNQQTSKRKIQNVSKNNTSTKQKVSEDSNMTRLIKNLVRNPRQAIVDGALYVADQMGTPTNATNFLRDINVSAPQQAIAYIRAFGDKIINGTDYETARKKALANPDPYTRFTTIHPLTNNEFNFSNKELSVIRDMADEKGRITNADIKRVSEDGKYGKASGSISSYFTPTKVVQTAIGQAAGDGENVTDVFDVNTQSNAAKRDNATYMQYLKTNPGFNYGSLRAILPYIGSIDIMPDEYKIHTKIKR